MTGTILSQVHRLHGLVDAQATLIMDKSSGQPANFVKYPTRALHEAIVNAVAHRDYGLDGPLRVTAFSDRLEIYSPGGLPRVVDVTEFQGGRATPIWRNQSLAWVLNRLQLAQAEGQGIATILREMEREGCPPPLFRSTPESVLVVLPAHPRSQIVRELQAAERLAEHGQIGTARQKLDHLLVDDPFNPRLIHLFCELEQGNRDERRLLAFVLQHEQELGRFSPSSRLLLADTLLSRPTRQAKTLGQTLLNLSMEEYHDVGDTLRLVNVLLRLERPEAALDRIDRSFRDHPAWSGDPTFLRLKGRILVALATKQFEKTLHADRAVGTLRDAEAAFQAALVVAIDEGLRDQILEDLKGCEELRMLVSPQT